jgi:thymidylate kinase
MIVSFTGAQSTGKTTLLNACKEVYSDKFSFVDEVTRLVKRNYNVPINEEGTDITQLFIINTHIENAFKVYDKPNGVILDRCIIDGLVYTGYLALEGKVSKWVFKYAKNVFNLLIPKVDKIFYTHPGDVELVADGERSVDLEFRKKIIDLFDLTFELYEEKLENKVVILKGTVEERMEQIKIHLC